MKPPPAAGGEGSSVAIGALSGSASGWSTSGDRRKVKAKKNENKKTLLGKQKHDVWTSVQPDTCNDHKMSINGSWRTEETGRCRDILVLLLFRVTITKATLREILLVDHGRTHSRTVLTLFHHYESCAVDINSYIFKFDAIARYILLFP